MKLECALKPYFTKIPVESSVVEESSSVVEESSSVVEAASSVVAVEYVIELEMVEVVAVVDDNSVVKMVDSVDIDSVVDGSVDDGSVDDSSVGSVVSVESVESVSSSFFKSKIKN